MPIPLTCGHYALIEEVERMSAWAPKGFPYYCEAEHEYRKRKPRERRKPLPEEPPF